MSKTTSLRTPKLRRHKASNRAYVKLNGSRIYLGRWEAPDYSGGESKTS